MGRDAYTVDYRRTGLPRDYEFFDLLEKTFSRAEDTGNTLIDLESWIEALEDWTENNPDILGKHEESIKCMTAILKLTDGDSVELHFG